MKKIIVNVNIEFEVEDNFDIKRNDFVLRGIANSYVETLNRPYECSDNRVEDTANVIKIGIVK